MNTLLNLSQMFYRDHVGAVTRLGLRRSRGQVIRRAEGIRVHREAPGFRRRTDEERGGRRDAGAQSSPQGSGAIQTPMARPTAGKREQEAWR